MEILEFVRKLMKDNDLVIAFVISITDELEVRYYKGKEAVIVNLDKLQGAEEYKEYRDNNALCTFEKTDGKLQFIVSNDGVEEIIYEIW